MEGGPKQADKLNIVAILAIGAVGSIAVYASFVGLQAFYDFESREVQERRNAEGVRDEYNAIQKQQTEGMDKYRPVQLADGVTAVGVPIDSAMDLIIGDVNAGRAKNLVPSVGAHDTPTVPAVWGYPTKALTPAPASPEGAAPEGAEGAAPEGAEGAAPEGAEGAAPEGAEGAAPEGAVPEGAAGQGGTEGAAPAAAPTTPTAPAAGSQTGTATEGTQPASGGNAP